MLLGFCPPEMAVTMVLKISLVGNILKCCAKFPTGRLLENL